MNIVIKAALISFLLTSAACMMFFQMGRMIEKKQHNNIIYSNDYKGNLTIDLPEEWPAISKDDLKPDTLIATLKNDTLSIGFTPKHK